MAASSSAQPPSKGAALRTGSFLVAGTALAVGIALLLRRAPSLDGANVLDAAPADAWLVATLDVAEAQPLIGPLIEASGGLAGATRVVGLGAVSAACGFEPLEHVRHAMIAVPEGGERGDFGVAVTTDSSLSADDLAACARKAIAARGGKPATATRGAFTVIADDADRAQAQLALHPGGPFLVGRGPWLGAMMAAFEGRGGRAAPEHAALRVALAAALEASAGSAHPAFTATVLLPKSLRDRLRSEEGEREGKAADAGGQSAFLGVLAVDRAGLAIARSRSGGAGSGGSTGVALELRCDAADGVERCADVKKLIERGRRALAQNFAVHLSGAGPLLDTLQIDAAGGALSARAHAPTDDLARALAGLYPRLAPGAPPVAPTP